MSGNGELKEASWYDRISAAVEESDNPLLIAADNLAAVLPEVATEIDATLLRPLPTGQRQGIGLHTLLQHLRIFARYLCPAYSRWNQEERGG